MKFTAKFLQKAYDAPDDDIQDPFCLCKHKFTDHVSGHNCEHCDCPGFDPASITKQVEMWCERRAFGRVGNKSNPMTFERGKNDRIMKVYFDGNRVSKVEFQGTKNDTPETRDGWDGFWSVIQTYGD